MSDWDSGSEQETDEEQQAENTITYVLIAIDCDDSMFERNEEELSTFNMVLKSCYEILDSQLMKGGKRGFCPIAVVIVTDDSDQITIIDFKENLLESLKKLRDLCDKSDLELENKYKRTKPIQMSSFLLQCKTKLNVLGEEYRKYIALITKNDNPVANDDNDKRLCVNQARSFRDFNIFIELLTFNPTFQCDEFYQEILDAANCRFSQQYLTDSLDLNESLLSLMTFRGRRAYFFPFPGKDTFFEIIEKHYIKYNKMLNNIIVTKDNHTEVKMIREELQYEEEYELRFAKEKTPMKLTANEVDAFMHDDIPCGFTLLGTHNRDIIELGTHCSDPTFIQKNNHINSPHFDIFWQYCVDKDSRLICTRKYKADGPMKLVQLTPKLINNVRSFLVLGIPFVDDIKYLDIHDPSYVSQETNNENVMEAAEKLVQAASFQYDINKINDSVICAQREYVRAELLEEKAREVPDILKLDFIEDDISEIVENFKILTLPTGIKRKAEAKTERAKK